MNIPKIKILEEKIVYTGAQLKPHWIYEKTSIKGDSAVAFLGPCKVELEYMVDLQDRYAGKLIEADDMLHILTEHFGVTLYETVLLQRLLVFDAFESLILRGVRELRREGDDLFVRDGKLSISVATVSPVSGLIHLGLNVTNEGTPTKTASLSDVGIEPLPFAEELLKMYCEECAKVVDAAVRVAPRL